MNYLKFSEMQIMFKNKGSKIIENKYIIFRWKLLVFELLTWSMFMWPLKVKR
jgi:hypothetical protein